jgi:hypothetical protein
MFAIFGAQKRKSGARSSKEKFACISEFRGFLKIDDSTSSLCTSLLLTPSVAKHILKFKMTVNMKSKTRKYLVTR